MGKAAKVLKFTRSDQSGYVLVNAYSRGSKPLDLQLEATEGDEHYGLPLRHDKVASLRIKSGPASESEWQDILQKLFQQEPQPEINATASVRDGKSIDIVVRKEIQGITQRLGEISIGVAKDAEYNVLDWCATAVDAAAESKAASVNAALKVEELEATIGDLKKQLDELITAKAEDETALLAKFRDLLNEKKVKIRQQQKIIASSSKDAGSQSASQPARDTSQEESHTVGKSRAGKRKAQEAAIKEEDGSSDDGFEPMEVEGDKAASDPEDTDREAETDATASTASDDEDAQEPTPSVASKGPPAKQAKSQPPPPRSLPFAKAKPQPTAPKAPVGGADSETESNDEL